LLDLLIARSIFNTVVGGTVCLSCSSGLHFLPGKRIERPGKPDWAGVLSGQVCGGLAGFAVG